MIASANAAQAAESTTTTLDFSLPSYDPSMKGFGEGSEAYSSKLDGKEAGKMVDPGSNEKDKQLRSMQLAEEARQQALAKKKAIAKARDEEEKRRAEEKKAKNAERFASIFN
jgi:hypothetical protein